MNRIVLFMETGRPATMNAAAWFAAQGDRVYLAGKTQPEVMPDGVRFLPMDPMNEQSLADAVQTVEAADGKLDIFVLGAGCHPKDGVVGTDHDADALADTMVQNICGSRQALEAFLPLLRKGMKRVAHITEQESSNTWSCGTEDLAYWSSMAAMNMMGKMMFNLLRPEGFTFRWYCDDELPGGMCAAAYIASNLCYDPKEPYTHSDENRFFMRNKWLQEIPW
ncbi:MAG: SDR family NAD(P)-dependent oxidoreductase [Clostridia bacterium]|nr:SDR family NAD(P)-dependent oxidoreductase [Clostridia bacterium]